MSCRVLSKSEPTTFNEIVGEYVLCQTGDSIYHYIESLDSLNLVMDFSAGVGAFWESFDQANNYESFGAEYNYKYEVTAIETIMSSNNKPLQVQYLREYRKPWGAPDNMYQFSGESELIEHIGFRGALLPTNGGDGFTDGQFETEVRCYEDGNLGLVKLTEDTNCLTSSIKYFDNTQLDIYPNPTYGLVNINGLEEIKEWRSIVYNQSGKNLISFHNSSEFIAI